MNSTLEIDGKLLYPIKDAAQATTYSRDYVTRLAREGKVLASYIGRQWFVDLDSLKSYAENAVLEQEVRRKILSDERKRERQLREAAERQHTLHIKKSNSLNARAAVTAVFVLGFGLLAGQGVYYFSSNEFPSLSGSVATEQPAQLSRGATGAEKETVPSEAFSFDEATASFEQYSLGEIDQGIMLFPAHGTITHPETLFSDAVEVRRLADGTQVVVPIDALGKQIGNEIPFVVVPVGS